MKTQTVTLDVREDLKKGREPFAKIMQTVSALKQNENLRLIAPFRPAPLFAVMNAKGFSHAAKQTTEGDWEVVFTREGKDGPASHEPVHRRPSSDCAGKKYVEIDARGLEPPQPLVKILEALPQIPDESEIKALTDRRPVHLYAHLDERGYVGRTEEQPDGSFATFIHRCKH